MRPLAVLLLCNRPVPNADAATVIDHIDAFVRHSRHRVAVLSLLGKLPARLDLDRFDVLVIHYSLALGYLGDHYLGPRAKERLAAFRGLKMVFIQDEYRAVNHVHQTLRMIGADVLYTCVPAGEIAKVYPPGELPGVRAINTLTGFVAPPLLEKRVPAIAQRAIDVGYRTRKPPFWLGELGFEKWDIVERVRPAAEAAGLRLDLSFREEDRLYGPAWIDFVCACRTMLGVESGASTFDFTGELQQEVDRYMAAHPQVQFREVQQRFLRPYEGRIRLNQISPRHFEAAALRTAMVLYEGEYSGILQPWRHFIPLRKDLANIGEVIAAIRDTVGLQAMVDRAYAEVACNPAYSYQQFVAGFDEVVSEEMARRAKPLAAHPSSPEALRRRLATDPMYLFRRLLSGGLQRILLGTRLRGVMFSLWGRLPAGMRQAARPLLKVIGR